MDHQKRLEFVQGVVDEFLIPVLKAKGNDYARQCDEKVEADDSAKNFKMVAERLKNRGFDRYDSWAVYYLKHELSLETWLNRRVLESEKLEGRLTDLINYVFILWGMLAEDGLAEFPKAYFEKYGQPNT